MSRQGTANHAVEEMLDQQAGRLEELMLADVVTYRGDIVEGAEDAFREAIETKNGRRPKLAVVLDTSGGYIEVAERIVTVNRKHYQEVDFYIPNAAMSAGTVLVMSGDAIFMDYCSILGPIDPQVRRPGGPGLIPALGYIIKYEALLDKDRRGELTTAEAQILVQCFDQAELYLFEQSRNLTITLLKQWLAKYKFKNWVRTQTRQAEVTDQMREDRASEIAKMLNDTERWQSHSRGIPMQILQRELNLQIEDIGANPELGKSLRTYYRLLTDYMMRRNHEDVLHAPGRYMSIWEG